MEHCNGPDDLGRQRAHQQARAEGIDPEEVDWLLRSVSDVDGLALKLGTFQGRSQIPLKMPLTELEQRWQQRLDQRVPVQYLVGETPWRDFSLRVSPAVLIPRPETELIIDLAREGVVQSPQAAALHRGIWVDLGTGSGAIALGLAQAFPQAQILAVDQSAAALAIAQANAERYGLGDRISFYQGSWFEPLTAYRGHLSAVVANPPYIPTSLLPTLQPEVIHHEPTAALDGGEDGLAAIRTLARQAPDYLIPGGLWLVEIMAGQGEAVKAILDQQGPYREMRICEDLAGRDRFVMAFGR
ncbi:MAG TPA: peptide chain release factor N(5)-glutamine methyltransferase [Leptolyngbyaceae cyanobacterium M65_K2018_010]|nr:peptide chain release factor N(5)-glutamine methyltransferase [Leptolyngbyaceae cyanobacterium M65_K2018_010]